MLSIYIPGFESFDSNKNKFIECDGCEITLEHSLLSISKWESKHRKPFLNNSNKTKEEVIDYIRCMTITKNVNPLLYYNINNDDLEKIANYINEPMTALTFNNSKTINGEVITNEIIYYWMITFNIPIEFQKWHLNKLLALIQVISIKSSPSKKLSRQELFNRNRELNNIRKKKLNTKG